MTVYQIAQERIESHSGIWQAIGRVLVYCFGLCMTMPLAETFLNDTYLANVGLFLIFSTVVELLFSAVAIPRVGTRMVYIGCVLFLGIVATTLLWNVHQIHGCSNQANQEKPAHTIFRQ